MINISFQKKDSILASFLLFVLLLSSCESSITMGDYNHDVSVISLHTDDYYLWSPDSGLYIVGSNGIAGCGGIANYNQKWEHPASITMINDGDTVFSDPIGFRIKGFCSRSNAQKSLGLYWRKEYGVSKLKANVFEDQRCDTYKRLLLRSSTNEFSHMRDALISSLLEGNENVDYQYFEPCALYLNNEYWGLYYMREMITPHLFKYLYGVDDDAVDMLKGSEMNPEGDYSIYYDAYNTVAHFGVDMGVFYSYQRYSCLLKYDTAFNKLRVGVCYCFGDI